MSAGPLVVFTDGEGDDISALILLIKYAAHTRRSLTIVLTRRHPDVLPAVANRLAAMFETCHYYPRVLYDQGNSTMIVMNEYEYEPATQTHLRNPVLPLYLPHENERVGEGRFAHYTTQAEVLDALHSQLNISPTLARLAALNVQTSETRTGAPTYVVLDVPLTFMRAVQFGLWITDSDVFMYGSFNFRQLTPAAREVLRAEVFPHARRVVICEAFHMYSGQSASLNMQTAPELYNAQKRAWENPDSISAPELRILAFTNKTWNSHNLSVCATTITTFVGTAAVLPDGQLNKDLIERTQNTLLAAENTRDATSLHRNVQAYQAMYAGGPYQMLAADGAVALVLMNAVPHDELVLSKIHVYFQPETGYTTFTPAGDEPTNIEAVRFTRGLQTVVEALTRQLLC